MTSDPGSSRQRDLFDTPERRVLDALPREIARVLEPLLAHDPVPTPALVEQVRRHLAVIEQRALTQEFVDAQLARAVAARCEALLAGYAELTQPAARRLVQAAAVYFVEDDDADGDTDSILGLDDDAMVVDRVAEELGRSDLRLELP